MPQYRQLGPFASELGQGLVDPTTGRVHSPYLDSQQAADYLLIANVDALYKSIPLNDIPHRRAGRKFLFLPSELDRWLLGEKGTDIMNAAKRGHAKDSGPRLVGGKG